MPKFRTLAILAVTLVVLAACRAQTPASQPTHTPIPASTPTATSTPVSSVELGPTELKYRLMDEYGSVFFCDPDYYPVAREGQEEQRAGEEFPNIQQNAGMFVAILNELGMGESDEYSDEQRLQVYREFKRLNAVALEQTGSAYSFELRTGEDQGLEIKGTIDSAGEITSETREQSFNTCPICLDENTLIDTPNGQVPVTELRVGDTVWTASATGERVTGTILKAGSSPVLYGHKMVRLLLDDGRELSASPGHPLADGRRMAELKAGDSLDGSTVISTTLIEYRGSATHDILPSGETGNYRANGILTGSTLADAYR